MPQQPVDIGLGLKMFPSKTVAEARTELDEQELAKQDREITRMKLADYVEQRNAQRATAKTKQDEDAFLSDALRRHTVEGKPDFDAVVKEAWTKYPDLAMSLEDRLAKGRSSMVDARMKDIDEKQKRMGLGKAYLDRIVDPQTFAINAPLIAEVDPELAQTLGPQFNPELIGKLHEGYPTEVQKLERTKAYYGSSNIRGGILFDLVHADDPEDYEATLKAAEELLPRSISKVIRQQFGTDTPETRQQIQTILDADEKAAKAPNLGSFEDYVMRRFGPNPTPQQIEQAKKAYNQADDRPPINITVGGGTSKPMPSEWKNAIDRAILFVPSINRKNKVELMNRLWSEGNTDELKDVIRQAAIEGENVDTKNQVRGRELTLNAIRDARSMLGELKDAGAPTSWFTGSLEDLARKVGTSTNPKLVAFKARMNDLLVQYRRAATGVQFSERESRDYASMFPNYSQTLPVNTATLEGLERAVSQNQQSYWTGKLGKQGAALIGVTGGKSGGGGDADVTVSRDAKGNLIIKRGG